ncbi:MAG: type II toxin-antitoxin system HicA family toxin [Armatimonadetes bacterium]|nr:type II toxin-antitoxin system HicA family toxin [Armatimonadota bacterium]
MNVRDLMKLLKDNGWYEARKGKGDHVIYEHADFPHHISVDGAPDMKSQRESLTTTLRRRA